MLGLFTGGVDHGLEAPKVLKFFGTSSGSCSGGLPINFFLQGTYLEMYLYWGTIGTMCYNAYIMFVNTLGVLFL